MSTQETVDTPTNATMQTADWVKLGAITAAASIVAVLVVQAIALSIWPETARFAPLDSYVRSAIFTLVPVIVATALLAWLANRSRQPVQTFVTISAVVLVISFIPDYTLPVPYKTVLASTVTAFLHVVAAAVTVPMLVFGYRRQAGR